MSHERARQKRDARIRRHRRVRKKVQRHGRAAAPGRVPLEQAHRAQVIDDRAGRTLAAASTVEADLRCRRAPATSTPPPRSASSSPSGPRPPASTKVVFDRGGFLYHGRVAAVADAAREAGLEF